MHAMETAAASTPGASTGQSVGGQQSPAVADLPRARARVLGCEIDRIDMGEAIAVCEAAIESRGSAQHIAVNVAKLMAMREDQNLRVSVSQCELVTADGQPLVWASRLLGDPLPSRVTGIDLMEALLARAAAKGYTVYILGATHDVLERAVARMRRDFPELQLAGYRDGYYDDAEEAVVAESIAAARPDILFVAMSSPRKEYFIGRYRQRMGVPLMMGVGGAIDVFAGIRRRAPALLQRLGLEWLFRLAQEPRRLLRRYLTTNTGFIVLLSSELMRGRLASSERPGWRRRPSNGAPS